MELIFTASALRGLRAMPKADAKRLKDALQAIADNHPQRLGYVTEITGSNGIWRARKGDYRATYRITEAAIVVEDADHRKEIYR